MSGLEIGMNDTTREEAAAEVDERDVLRARFRLAAAAGPVYDHLVALPVSMRAARIQQLLVLGYMYELQLYRGNAVAASPIAQHAPDPTTPTRSKRTTGEPRPRSVPDHSAHKAVSEAVSAARTTALERIGALGSMLPAE
jgi:hypothetical protein